VPSDMDLAADCFDYVSAFAAVVAVAERLEPGPALGAPGSDATRSKPIASPAGAALRADQRANDDGRRRTTE
jgi:hypothetical protein